MGLFPEFSIKIGDFQRDRQIFFDILFFWNEIAAVVLYFIMSIENKKNKFVTLLLKWNREKNTRTMPWKGEKDPYKIWISEIILQQTRVEQGLDYYKRFIKTFPDINKLAKTSDQKVMKMWEGLGYYSRCRNLLSTARTISKNFRGKFPDTYDSIKSLKGIGSYTASAISSFAFNLPHAVVDGNVYRVLSRVFGIKTAVDTTEGKKYFNTLAEELLDKKQPGIYNQAIMDFGATVCKPVSPECNRCYLKKHCYAFTNDVINELPVKEKKVTVRKRWFYYMVIQYKKEVLIRQRIDKDIWLHLYEFPVIEMKKKLPLSQIKKLVEKIGTSSKNISISSLYTQQLSHQKINAFFIRINLKERNSFKSGSWITHTQLKQFAFPGIIRNFLEEFI